MDDRAWYWINHILILFSLGVYMLFGSGMFLYLERATNKDLSFRRIEQRAISISDGICTDLRTIHICHDVIRKTLAEKHRPVICRRKRFRRWNFIESAVFSGSLVTTIGYGAIAPETWQGRLFTVFYAMIGIPLMLIFLARIGHILGVFFVHCWSYFRSKFCGYARLSNDALVEFAAEESDFPLSIPILITIAWVFACGALFLLSEDWSYFTAVYFSFITLSTIGLGDVVPSKTESLLFGCMLVFIGLSLLSMCINLIQVRMEQIFDAVMARIKAKEVKDQLDSDMIIGDVDIQKGFEDMILNEGGGGMAKMFMGEQRRKILMRAYEKRITQKVKSTQTKLHGHSHTPVQCQRDVDETAEMKEEGVMTVMDFAPIPMMETHQAKSGKGGGVQHMDEVKKMLVQIDGILEDCKGIISVDPILPS